MEIKKIVEGMTATTVAKIIDENFKGLSNEKANVNEVNKIQAEVNNAVNIANNAKSTAEQAVGTANIAKEAIKTLEGLANTTTAQETLASQVVQIEENKQNIDANKVDVDTKLTDLASEVNNINVEVGLNINFISGTIAGFSAGTLYYSDNDSRARFVIDVNNIKKIKIINSSYKIKAWAIYDKVLPTASFIGEGAADIKELDVELEMSTVIGFVPKFLGIVIVNAYESTIDAASLKDIVSVELIKGASVILYSGLLKESYIESLNCYVNATTGEITQSEYYSTVTTKYRIEQGFEYYATGRTGTASTDTALACYFDKDNTYLGCEYRKGTEIKKYDRVKLTIPDAAMYVYILGTIQTYNDRVVPLLYSTRQEKYIYNRQNLDAIGIMKFTDNSVTIERLRVYSHPNSWQSEQLTDESVLKTHTFNEMGSLVLHIDNTCDIVQSYNEIKTDDIILLRYYRGRGGFVGGVLFKEYIRHKAEEAKKLSLSSLVSVEEEFPNKYVDFETGEIVNSAYTNVTLSRKYIIKEGLEYYATGRVGTGGNVALVHYFDNDNNYLGCEFKKGDIAYKYERVKLTIPSGTKYIILNGSFITYSDPYPPYLYVISNDADSVFKDEYRNKIIYKEENINSDIITSVEKGAAYIERGTTKSAWGVVFPNSYNPSGKPSQIIAMFHGSTGYVTENVMGYNTDAWVTWRKKYLDAGFVVMDINGWGVSTKSDEKSAHYGNPRAVETVKKALTYLVKNYNVNHQILIHATSMGGTIAYSYTLTYPNDVIAVGCFASAILLQSKNKSGYNEKMAKSWGYDSVDAMNGDNLSKLVGYDLIMNGTRIDKNGIVSPITTWSEFNMDDYISNDNYDFMLKFPCPIRIWQGTSDDVNPYQHNQTLVKWLRNGGCNATLRLCTDAEHDMSSGALGYVKDEAVDWFLRMM